VTSTTSAQGRRRGRRRDIHNQKTMTSASSARAPERLRGVLLAGGGTAGHAEPALAVADAIRAAHPDADIRLLGTTSGVEARLVPARGYPLELVPKVPLPRRLGTDLLAVPWRLTGAVRATSRLLKTMRPDVVVGFGGYVSVPAYLAARRHGIPIVVHEANPLPGVANRLGARLTRYVAISQSGTRLPHAVLTGLPLRPALVDLDRAGRRADARAAFGLDPQRPTLLVFGGSQGARRINDAAVAAARALTQAGVQVLHAAGAKNVEAVTSAVPGGLPSPYEVRAYIDDMPAAYAAADLALCRAGAMTCAELAAVGLPAVYVPLPIGNGEQRLNAEPVVAAGGGLLVDDAELDGGWIERQLLPILTAPERLAEMSAAARRSAAPDAAAAVLQLIERAAGQAQRPES
jgi:UDP-N-acetylglucosamine--N-acetylmuramyl-(pentapeptide) pyrophosphoryl-undecaprenol N-acetylglucosamine transferase